MKRVDDSSMRTGSNDHYDGDKNMKKNKSVYVVFTGMGLLHIYAVCALEEDVQMYLEMLKNKIIDFLRSDKVAVTIEDISKFNPTISNEASDYPRLYKDEEEVFEEENTMYCIQSNVPSYYPLICKAEVEDSQDKSLSEIQHVWVVWSEVDPYSHTVHLTKQAMEEYLKSKGWMDDNGEIKDNVVVQYEKFDVTQITKGEKQ